MGNQFREPRPFAIFLEKTPAPFVAGDGRQVARSPRNVA
jgi:hypothetical protein